MAVLAASVQDGWQEINSSDESTEISKGVLITRTLTYTRAFKAVSAVKSTLTLSTKYFSIQTLIYLQVCMHSVMVDASYK